MGWSSVGQQPTAEQPQRLCLDAAYDSTPGVQGPAVTALAAPCAQSWRGATRARVHPGVSCKEMGGGRQPFVAQPLAAASGAALEKKVENYLAFLHLACAQLIFAKVLVFG